MVVQTRSRRRRRNSVPRITRVDYSSVKSAIVDRMVALRRAFHRYPELSWHENHTASRICKTLGQLGIPYQRGIAGTGVVADIPGPEGVPAVALRADMDALPIREETELPFASIYEGVMHACGHDGHMSMLLGAAELLAADRALPAPVRLLFQPAEETGDGAKAMVRAGALDGVGMVFGGHLDLRYPTGSIIVTEGVVNASADTFEIRITGQQAHGARPQEGIDVLVVGSLMVTALQTLVSREVDPAYPAVVSVGSFHAGSAANVIAGTAILQGTIRAQVPEVREQLKAGVVRMAEAIGTLHGASVVVHFPNSAPLVLNASFATALARRAAHCTVPVDQVGALDKANMGSEDFSYYLCERPGCYVRFGAQLAGGKGGPLHSSTFDFDEGVLPVGAQYYAHLAREAGAALAQKRAA